jgi:hypothetical protein
VLQLTSFPPPRGFSWRTKRRDVVRLGRKEGLEAREQRTARRQLLTLAGAARVAA